MLNRKTTATAYMMSGSTNIACNLGSAEVGALPTSPLLRLPGELRNEIYRYALVEADNEHIRISKHIKPAQPGILQVNRQCRKESADIFYAENTFAFGISHFDAAIYISWCKSSSRRRWCQTTASVSRSQNWANLLVWLEAYWNQECGGIVGNSSKANADAKAATHLFSMVKKMRDGKMLPWEDAREVLEDAHAALAEIKPRWAWRSGQADMVTSLR